MNDGMPINTKNTEEIDYTPEQLREMSLFRKCIQIDCFMVEDRIFKGYFVSAVKEFTKNNPQPADFYVWLQDNYTELR